MKTPFEPRLHRTAFRFLTAGSLLCLGACGGGGAGGLIASVVDSPSLGGGAGIGGTGFSSTGTLDGTGSIFVNGVRFDVHDAEIFVNGEAADESALGLGMIVTVTGTLDDSGVGGIAERVDYDAELEGPIDAIERNVDNSSARLTLLGQTVIVERTSTVFENSTFDALAPGDVVEISGVADAEGRLRATRVEGEDDPDGEVSLSGVVSELDGLIFNIGKQRVDASGATLTDLDGNSLANGARVEVDGTLVDGVLVATGVEGKENLATQLQADDQITALGSISNFNSISDFTVEGLPVDAGSADLNTGGIALGNGQVVEVSGVWDGTRVVADSVSVRRGRIEIEAPLDTVDSDTGTITFRFGNESVSVSTDARTLIDDDRDGVEYLAIADLAVGDFLEVEAIDYGGTLLATRIDRDDASDETELQAPVQSFVDGLTVTLLGITFDVSMAEFENAADDDIDASVFFANLSVGALLNITDLEPTDGFAEEVEFEFATALPGDREFSDDDEERIAEADLPDALIAYIEENYPGAGIAFAERDDDEIEVYLTDGTELVFALDGTFIESEDEDDDFEDGDSEVEDDSDDEDESEDDEEDSDDEEESGDEEESDDEEDSEDEEESDEEDEPEDEDSEDDEDPEDPNDPEDDEEPEDPNDP